MRTGIPRGRLPPLRATRACTIVTLLVLLVGCAKSTPEAPLRVNLGLDRAATTRAMSDHQYCWEEQRPPTRYENYKRCERPGPEWGESWVTTVFDQKSDKLVEVRRWERFTDAGRATERWNQLIGDRAKTTPMSDEALATLRASGLLQAGTKALKAFRDGDVVIGVYLLEPTPPEEASILERIVALPAKR